MLSVNEKCGLFDWFGGFSWSYCVRFCVSIDNLRCNNSGAGNGDEEITTDDQKRNCFFEPGLHTTILAFFFKMCK